MALELETLNALTSVTDVAQIAAAAAEKTPAWLGGILGMCVVMVALASVWLATSIVGGYFNKKASQPGKTEAAPKGVTAPQPAAAASDDIPLAVIIAAAVQMVQAPIRNVVVNAPGMAAQTWATQGRQAIYASHHAKAPQAVTTLGTIRKK